jgi:NAD(P)H-nitrite reductase large subunit
VIGLGAAGAQAVSAIRAQDPDGDIRVFSEEPWPFYFRASLPQYVMGRLTREHLWGFPEGHLERLKVDRISARVVAVDTEVRQVVTDGSGNYPFDRVLLACGTERVPLSCPGADLDGVLSLRRLGDADVMKGYCREQGRVVVVGGGMAGLTIAYIARQRGMGVTLLVPEESLGAPWLDARGSQLLYRHLVEDGVVVHLGEGLANIEGSAGKVAAVRTTRGKGIACSWVGVGQGGRPRTALAGAVTDGAPLKVKASMETQSAGVYAAGDMVQVRDAASGDYCHTQGWQAASLQGKVAGTNMAGGRDQFHMRHCYQASMLYDLPLTFIGRADAKGDAEVTSPQGVDGYRRLVFKNGRLIGATILGDRRHANVIRRVVEMGQDMRGHELQLLRTDIDLNHLLRPSGEYHLY